MMQWHEHTPSARMQLIVDDYLERQTVYRDERDGVKREKSSCPECGNETFWVIYDHRHPIAGCTHGECRVQTRMGLFDTLIFVWDEEEWGELPEEKSERKRRLGQKLDEISAHYLQAEEEDRREALEEERQGRRQAEENAEKCRNTAGQWKGKAEQLESRAAQAERAQAEAETRLKHRIDRMALYKAITRATAAFAATVLFLSFFLTRADTGMLFEWNAFGTALYLLVASAPVWYFAYAVVHRDVRGASARNEMSLALHELLDLRDGVSWGLKILACLVGPYLLIDPVARSVRRLDGLDSFLQASGIEWLLLCTGAALMCVFSVGAWMAKDLPK